MSARKNTVKAYTVAFSQLKENNANKLYELVSEDILFTDPFNCFVGKDKFKAVFEHMFETCDDPSFIIIDVAHSKSVSYLKWQMNAKLKRWPRTSLNFVGMTEVHVDDNFKICKHIDHWDSASQLLKNLPLIGMLFLGCKR